MTVDRVSGLDFLRGFAALAVAIPHFFILKAFYPDLFESVSVLGVEIFFVLSGYVLAPQILKCLSQPLSQLGVFLVRRWMRTIPAYAVALICTSVLFGALGTADFFRYLTYTQNLFTQSNNTDYYSIAWSLSVEEWFYIVFPIAMIACVRLCRLSGPREILFAAIAFIAIVTLMRISFGPVGDWGPSVRRVVAFRIDSIAYGFLLYLILNHQARGLVAKVSSLQAIAMLIITAGLAMWTIEMIARDGSNWPKHLFPFAAAAFGSACIVAALCANRWLERRPKLSKLGIFAGQISYSVYLFHLLVMTILSPITGQWPLALQLAVYTLTVIGFAAIFYRTFEQPILMARPEFKFRSLQPAF